MSDDHKKNFVLAAIFIVLLAILVLTGCANISVTPPKPRPDATLSRNVSGNFDEIWSRAIGWFDAHEVEITEIDERSGTINGLLSVPEEAAVLDCGIFHFNRALSAPKVSRDAHVRIQMRDGFSRTPHVLVAVTGSYHAEMIDNYAAQTITRNGPCVSLGKLEADIFAFLRG